MIAGLEAESFVAAQIKANANLLVPFYLSTSWLYYERDESIISDDLYGVICERLDREWDSIEHWHKGLVDRSSLAAGTGYYLQVPERVANAAWALFLRFQPPARRRRRGKARIS